MRFYLGIHQPAWLATAGVPLMVSNRWLARRRSLPRAAAGWVVDSGGFSELSLYGEWRTTPEEYVRSVRRYDAEIGQLEWAAPQDWMCEPIMLAKTGLGLDEHQRRSVANLLRLRDLWAGDDCPFIPVLQGWALDDYLRCVDLYERAGVSLARERVVGVGSVCRRQNSDEIAAIITALHQCLRPAAAVAENNLHGFGIKAAGLARYGSLLGSADSMAWSFRARRSDPLPGCVGHKNCANCLRYALAWRERVAA